MAWIDDRDRREYFRRYRASPIYKLIKARSRLRARLRVAGGEDRRAIRADLDRVEADIVRSRVAAVSRPIREGHLMGESELVGVFLAAPGDDDEDRLLASFRSPSLARRWAEANYPGRYYLRAVPRPADPDEIDEAALVGRGWAKA